MSVVAAVRPEHPQPRSLAGLVATLPGLSVVGAVATTDVTGVTHDSRQVRPGDLYAAIAGAQTHGAEHAHAAVESGAVAVLTDRAGTERAAATGRPVVVADDPRAILGDVARWVYGDPSSALMLIGVTGTNGKTTTAYLLESGLRHVGRATGLIGTVETRVGTSVVPSVRTTPEATDLQALFAAMVEHGVSAVAMEVSSHALALHRVDGARFDVAVFTNLSQDHLDFHSDIEDYFAAKASLFTPERAARAVIDVDDAYGARLATSTSIPAVTVSPAGDRNADWWVDGVSAAVDGSSFTLHTPAGTAVSARISLPGAFNVRNATLAIAALVECGVAVDDAVAGVAACTGVPGRMERVDAGQPYLALVDYAHTPDAVTTLLETVRPLVPGRVIVVLGCGGDRDRGKRPLMGAAAARGADVAVLTSDNPRSEDPEAILDAIAAGAADVPAGERAEVRREVDRRAAIRLAVGLAGAGDAVVVAGKGHERTQEIGTTMLPFDDVGELRAAIDSSPVAG